MHTCLDWVGIPCLSIWLTLTNAVREGIKIIFGLYVINFCLFFNFVYTNRGCQGFLDLRDAGFISLRVLVSYKP